jgi:hypothetical protein
MDKFYTAAPLRQRRSVEGRPLIKGLFFASGTSGRVRSCYRPFAAVR